MLACGIGLTICVVVQIIVRILYFLCGKNENFLTGLMFWAMADFVTFTIFMRCFGRAIEEGAICL